MSPRTHNTKLEVRLPFGQPTAFQLLINRSLPDPASPCPPKLCPGPRGCCHLCQCWCRTPQSRRNARMLARPVPTLLSSAIRRLTRSSPPSVPGSRPKRPSSSTVKDESTRSRWRERRLKRSARTRTTRYGMRTGQAFGRIFKLVKEHSNLRKVQGIRPTLPTQLRHSCNTWYSPFQTMRVMVVY